MQIKNKQIFHQIITEKDAAPGGAGVGIHKESYNMKGQVKFKITNWKEISFSEVNKGGKLTRASVAKSYTGEIEGEGVLEYLMTYNSDGSANFYGLERVSGKIGNRSGSFVLQHDGEFENGEMNQKSVIVAGSGTGELTGLRGESKLSAGHQQEYAFTLDYELE